MSRLVIPDAGPLFSLAAGDLLDLLSHFRVGITDMVKEETIDRGLIAGASIEAKRILAYYNANAAQIEIFDTQVGATIKAARAVNPAYKTPKNIGELSIQSMLIDLQLMSSGNPPVVLFEDSWFLNNAAGLAKPCILISTQAFLGYAERKRWIKSAERTRQSIARLRPDAANINKIVRIG
jgi:hypothetical protein